MLANVNGIQIYYDVVGGAFDDSSPEMKPKPVIIVLNGGYGFNHDYIRPALHGLSDRFQLIYTDMRGCGASTTDGFASVTIPQMAKDVNEFMRVIGIKKAYLLGHQSGSFIAQQVAISYSEHVQGLLLFASNYQIGAVPGDNDDNENTPFLKSRTSDNDELNLSSEYMFYKADFTQAQIDQYWSKIGKYYLAPENESLFKDIFSFVISYPAIQNQFRKIMIGYNSSKFVGSIACPTLICNGSYDWMFPPVTGKMLQKKIRFSRYEEFTGSGHYMMFEENEKFLQVITDFISQQN